jgi:glucosamine--fructose-6-phosphate aminotransferase (isomerizing)
MQSLGKFPDPFLRGILEQPAAIRRAADGLAEQGTTLERIRRTARRDAPVVLTGMGGSHHACHPAVNLLAAAGVPALHVDAAELLHFRLPVAKRAGTIVFVSQSGESAEVVRLATVLATEEDRPPLTGITNGPGGTLGRSVDHRLDTRAGPEEGPATVTFAAATVVLAALGRVLAGSDVGAAIDRVQREAGTAARLVEELIREPTVQADLLSGLLTGRRLALLARGPGLAAAEMGALTLKESGVPAEAVGTAEFRHGPLELAGPDLGVLVLATESATRELDLRLAAHLVRAGATVVVISEDGVAPGGAHGIAVGRLGSDLVPVPALVPVQLLAWRLATLAGRRPGEYLRAAKVTTDE